MSTFLQLCQKVHLILRIGAETPGTEPQQVTGQTGVLAEIVQWVNNAHDDVCREYTAWAFMRGSGSFTLASGARTITKAAMVAVVPAFDKINPFVSNEGAYVGLTPTAVSGGAEEVVEYVPYQQWLGTYDAPPLPTGTPRYFTITPDLTLEFDAVADQDYSIRTGYRKTVTPLAGNNDVPMFDADYHNVLVWWAIVHYYCPSRDDTVELQRKADRELSREFTKLKNEQLPDITLG